MKATAGAIMLLALAAYPSIPEAAEISGIATVVDGATLTISDTRIRLHAIDASEGRQSCRRSELDWPCGSEATAKLRDLVAGQVVSCYETDRDRYGRTVAVCIAGNAELVASLSRIRPKYVHHEVAAQEARRGLWTGER
ncbi:MAG TPA: thermonuclease family protein [Dehalococcoidia bacterium]|jgi:endonuclease YncB( thermonuclease family)|nr:thermonuclease family protein [Dehalococcoidia bacterium]